jgi:hypothetical protein
MHTLKLSNRELVYLLQAIDSFRVQDQNTDPQRIEMSVDLWNYIYAQMAEAN